MLIRMKDLRTIFNLLIFLCISVKITQASFTNLQAFWSSDTDEDESLVSDNEVFLIPGSPFYYAQVTFGDNSNQYYQDPPPTVLFALYNSLTLFAANCSDFYAQDNPYNYFACSSASTTQQLSTYPYLQASGVHAIASVNFGGNSSLSVSGVIASSCNLAPNTTFGSNAMAIIGMGTIGVNQNSQMNTSYFSVYLSPNLLNNRLLFYFDPNKAQTTTPNVSLVSDGNWHVNKVSNIQIGDQFVNISSNVSLIFDMNFDGIVLPPDVYQIAMTYLIYNCLQFESSSDSETETETQYDFTELPRPVCGEILSDIPSLPPLNITVQNQYLIIPPEVYIKSINFTGQTVAINIVSVGASEDSRFNLTSAYQNTIILGANVMSYYYTVFDARNGTNTIDLYLSNQNFMSTSATNVNSNTGNIIPEQSGGHLALILSLCGVFILIVLGFCYCIYKRRSHARNLEGKKGLLDESTEVSKHHKLSLQSYYSAVPVQSLE